MIIGWHVSTARGGLRVNRLSSVVSGLPAIRSEPVDELNCLAIAENRTSHYKSDPKRVDWQFV